MCHLKYLRIFKGDHLIYSINIPVYEFKKVRNLPQILTRKKRGFFKDSGAKFVG